MSRTVTAFFDSRDDAERARARLSEANIDANRVRIVEQSHTGSSSSGSSGEDQGFWNSLKSAFLPDEDSHAYEEGMRRGGYLLCAEVEDNQEDTATRILDQDGTVDFHQRQQEWRSSGWQGFQSNQQTGSQGLGTQQTGRESMTGETGRGSITGETSRTVQEEHIPLVEEELRVGKREVARGGARVRSYVKEVPVHEQVTLREEHVSVERRPVDQKLGAQELGQNADLLRDRTVEMTEASEEAVVAKEARVREELVLRKTAEEHVEQIDDTVRRTEVDVDEGLNRTGGNQDRSAFSSFGGEKIPNDADRIRSESDRDRATTNGSGYSSQVDKSGF